MIHFKACPRCVLGDMVTEYDEYGEYYLCLQCGHTGEIVAEVREPVLAAEPDAEEPVSVAA